MLIEAIQSLADPKLHLVVAGEASDQDREYKEMLARAASGNANIRFVGWLGRMDIYKYLDMATLAVFPASQSILWQQAISMGLPLIVGDVGHQSISYLNLENNIVILPNAEIRSDRLAKVIAEVISDPGRMREMSEGAMRVSNEHLNWDKLILRTLRFNEQSTRCAK